MSTADRVANALGDRIGHGVWVSMGAVVDAFGWDITTLTELVEYIAFSPLVDVVSEDNRKGLSAHDRECAVYLGGRYLHFIRVR